MQGVAGSIPVGSTTSRDASGRPPFNPSSLQWSVDELTRFRGHVWVRGWTAGRPDPKVAVLLPDGSTVATTPSPVADPHAPADAVGFAAELRTDQPADTLRLAVDGSGGREVLTDLAGPMTVHDPYHQLQQRFFADLRQRPRGRLLEIGSRARSGVTRASLTPPGWEHVGIDLVPGDGVDVVVDAHELASPLPPRSFDAAFAVSVFEHLLMPWEVVAQLHQVLRRGAPVLVVTHQSFPLHDRPADYWRYSDNAWHALFNRWSGFRVEAVALGERAHVVPVVEHAVVRDTAAGGAYLGSAVVARKAGRPRRRSGARVGDLVPWGYPA